MCRNSGQKVSGLVTIARLWVLIRTPHLAFPATSRACLRAIPGCPGAIPGCLSAVPDFLYAVRTARG